MRVHESLSSPPPLGSWSLCVWHSNHTNVWPISFFLCCRPNRDERRGRHGGLTPGFLLGFLRNGGGGKRASRRSREYVLFLCSIWYIIYYHHLYDTIYTTI